MRLVLAVVPAVFAVVVLIGWGIDNESLKRLWTISVTMNPTSAVNFILLSAGVIVGRLSNRAARALAVCLFGLVAIIGAVKLFEIIGGSPVAIDTYVFASKLTVGDLRPSRIAPNAALCYLLISLALLIMRAPTRPAAIIAQLLALATALISLFAIVGYLYDVGAFYAVPAFFPMAIHTAVAFLCLCSLVFVDTAQRGLVAPISDTGPAGRTARALLPAAIIIPVAAGWLRRLGERAGWYGPEVGVAMMVMVAMLSMTVLIWWNADLLLIADRRRRQAEVDLARMATRDFLTGLPNRSHFMDRLLRRMAPPRRRNQDSFAIIYMDLDGFKQVNDRLGHAAGDQLLREVAAHIQACGHRAEDVAARLGGDEFAMLLDNIRSADDATTIAARIVEGMPTTFGPPGAAVPVGISVGIVLADVRHQTPESLLNEADHALYDAKRNGKGRYTLFPAAVGLPVR